MNSIISLTVALHLCGITSATIYRRQDGPVPSGTIKDCTYFVDAADGDTCGSIAANWGITTEQFTQYVSSSVSDAVNFTWLTLRYQNPSVGADCSGLVVGDSYCVEENYGNGPESTTTQTTTPTTTPTNAPSPTQTGLTKSCQRYYKVVDGDTCGGIVDNFHEFTLQDFYSWNPAVGDQCEHLLSGYYVCIGVPGTPTTPITTPTPKTTGVSPTQTGIVSDCTKYYQAVSGDSCDSISRSFGTFTISDFVSWNPAVKTDCSGLYAGYYYCVAVPGTPTSRTTSSTSPTPTGPSPTQSGIVSNCQKYYKAASGDTCQKISDKFGTFTVAQFEKWNPAVKSDCSGLFAGYYYCIAVPGTPTTKSKTSTPSPTSTGPQPEQSGIVKNCNKYYKVASGDTCDTIEKSHKITAANFFKWNTGIKKDCSNLFLGYYVCVGVKAS